MLAFHAAGIDETLDHLMTGLAGFGRIDGDANAAGAKHSGGGLSLGADRELHDGLRAGAASYNGDSLSLALEAGKPLARGATVLTPNRTE